MLRAIQKSIVGVVGVPQCGFHQVWEAKVTYPLNTPSDPRVQVQVYSWESEDKKQSGGGILWNWVLPEQTAGSFVIPVSALEQIEEYLTETEGSPFHGGKVVDLDSPESVLKIARRRKWDEVERNFHLKMREPLEVEGVGVFKADDYSQGKIKDVALMATACAAMGLPFSVYFTDVNREPVHLDKPVKAQKMALALADREQKLRTVRHQLRLVIDSEEITPEELQAISWEK